MLRGSLPRSSFLRWTPSSVPCSLSQNPTSLNLLTILKLHRNLPLCHSRSMSVYVRVGFRLHDLNSGLLSRELRLRVSLPITSPDTQLGRRRFHTSKPNRAWPIIGLILGGLKSSTALGVLNTFVRVALTFIPAIMVKSRILSKIIKKIPTHFPQWEHKIPKMTQHLAWNSRLIRILLTVPLVLLGATMLASVERAPLTGRWRFILISPTEEAEIVKSLSGNWRTAVDAILASTLSSDHPPPAILSSDWRYKWVEQTLRRLEAVVPLLQLDQRADPDFWNDDKEYPFPPPCPYPLLARPRPAQVIHCWAAQAQFEEQESDPISSTLVGPPYSCLVVEKPDSQNAFSYGFGPNGAGGIVVYTGFLDEVLHNTPYQATEVVEMPSFWSRIFGTIIATPRRQIKPFTPCEAQTAELAVLLAHELAHLLLSHHLETLSSGTILYPSVLSIFTDMARTVLFPITMMFGPFVNDALGQMGKVHTGEIGRLGEMCSGRKLEIEADIVSVRLLAYAGFDPREAIKFWENRIDESKRAECAIQGRTFEGGQNVASWAMGSDTHPLHEERVRRLKQELENWHKAWLKLQQPPPLSTA